MTFRLLCLKLCVFIFLGCSCPKETDRWTYKIVDISESTYVNHALDTILKEFVETIKKYKSGSVNLVAYMKIVESKNNVYKIHLEGISKDTVITKVNIDHAFLKDGILFCIDYNIADLLREKKKTVDKKHLIEYSQLNKYKVADTKLPSWLVLIDSNKISKINHNANSLFGTPYHDKIRYFDETSTKSYKVDEWGFVYNESGIIIDTLEGS